MSEDFIREVDEELKEEKYAKIWKKISPFVISLALGIVIFTTGIVGWDNYVEKSKQKLGDDFTAAVELIKEEDIDTALIALERITDKSSDGYVTLSKMKKAAILISKNNVEEGLNIYLDIENTAIDQSFRDMATILYVLNALDYKEPSILLDKINRLSIDSPWKFSALELKAFVYYKNKDLIRSKEIFNEIVSIGNAPSTLSSRARDMIEFLEVK